MITLTFEPTNSEQAALLGKFLPQYMQAGTLQVSGEPEQVKAVVELAAEAVEDKPAKKPKAAKPAATPAVTEETATASSAPAAVSPSEVTLEQVRAKLAALSQAGKAATVKDLISQYGVAKLTDVPKDRYAELLAAAEEIA